MGAGEEGSKFIVLFSLSWTDLEITKNPTTTILYLFIRPLFRIGNFIIVTRSIFLTGYKT